MLRYAKGMMTGQGHIWCRLYVFATVAATLAGCATYQPLPLDKASLPPKAEPLTELLDIEDIVSLALQNNPELLAVRSQRGVAQAQLLVAGILPNPSLTGSYGVLLSGPGSFVAISAGLTQDLKSLVTYSAKRNAAREAAKEVDASLLWQEWQTVGKARLMAVDLIEGERQLRLLNQAADLLNDRLARTRRSLDEGDSTLSTLAPDLAGAADARRKVEEVARQQQLRKHALNIFLGLSPSSLLVLNEKVVLPAINSEKILQSLDDLADRRPDLVALQLGYASQEEKLRAAILAQFPLLSLGLTGGRDTSNVVTLGPQITIDLPLFDRNQGNIAIERATRQRLHDEFSARLTAARAELRGLLIDQALLQAQYISRQNQVLELNHVVENAESAYKAGDLDERSAVDLISTRNAKQQEVLMLEQNLLELQVAIVTLVGAGMPTVSLSARETKP